jgi:hypothetical protein
MPTSTYVPLATITLGSASATVTFSSIPATYRDLVFVLNGTDSTTNTQGSFLRMNGDASNQTVVYVTNASSATAAKAYINTTDPSTRNTAIVQIMDYAQTDKHKTFLARAGASGSLVWMSAGRWASTAAVTSVSFHNDLGNFSSGSTFSLYGIAA